MSNFVRFLILTGGAAFDVDQAVHHHGAYLGFAVLWTLCALWFLVQELKDRSST